MTTGTSTQSTPPPTATEIALQEKQLEMSTIQVEQLKKQAAIFDQLSPGITALTSLQIDQLTKAAAEADNPQLKQLQQQAIDRELKFGPEYDKVIQAQIDAALQGGKATPEQIGLIDEATGAAYASGAGDIDTATREAIGQIREELAPSLGLHASDSPIIDRGGKIAIEGLRLKGRLASDLEGANAQSRLQYPLAAAQVGNAVSSNAQNLNLARSNFQQQLSSAALANRLNLSSGFQTPVGTAVGMGQGLSLSGYGNPSGALSALVSSRNANATTTTDPSLWSSGVALVGALSGAAQGAGAVGLKFGG